MKILKKHSLCRVLTKLMQECDIDDASLSRETGVPASNLSRLRLISDSNPTASTLRPIAKFFDISISQLLGDEPIPENRLPGIYNPSGFTTNILPVLEWDWIENWLENKFFPNGRNALNWISSENYINDKSFALIIPDNTFGLFLRKGSVILIDPLVERKNRDFVLVKSIKEKTLLPQQIIFKENNTYLRSINPDIKRTDILSEDNKIFGVIIETRYLMNEETNLRTARPKSNNFVGIPSMRLQKNLS